jgi:hypothetical protein
VLAGYLKVDHTVYDKPHGEAIQKLVRGEQVTASLVEGQSNWYVIRVIEADGAERTIGYTLNPWLDEVPPLEINPRPVSADESAEPAAQPVSDASPPPAMEEPVGVRFVHLFTNVRAAPTVESEAVAQIPPGTELEVIQEEGTWALVRLPGAVTDQPLGYVSGRLLTAEPPTTQQTTMVYITRTGSKYHQEGCRHLRSSKYALTLDEALEEGYEACKVCKPPQGQ